MMIMNGNVSAQILTQNLIKGVDSYPLLAIPFFMIAGEIMNEGGLSLRIVRFAQSLLGHIKGGIGYVGVVASMIFAGVSGSAVADTTAVGSVLLPIMKENKYDLPKSTALICAAGCIGPIIPPSIPMIIYGVVAEVSIVRLFLGGIIPGIIIGVGLMIFWSFHTKKSAYPILPRAGIKEVFRATREAFWALMLPVIILGGIVTGVATPTEASVVATVYAFLVSKFIYRELKFAMLPRMLVAAIRSTSLIMLVVGGATTAAYLVTTAHIPELLSNALLSITTNIYVLMLLINILLLLVGCVMDMGPAILILAPILVPIIKDLGLDPVYFGVIMVVNLCIGLLTPPVGNVLYVGISLSKLDMATLVKGLVAPIAVMVACLLIITYFPWLILVIPSLV